MWTLTSEGEWMRLSSQIKVLGKLLVNCKLVHGLVHFDEGLRAELLGCDPLWHDLGELFDLDPFLFVAGEVSTLSAIREGCDEVI